MWQQQSQQSKKEDECLGSLKLKLQSWMLRREIWAEGLLFRAINFGLLGVNVQFRWSNKTKQQHRADNKGGGRSFSVLSTGA